MRHTLFNFIKEKCFNWKIGRWKVEIALDLLSILRRYFVTFAISSDIHKKGLKFAFNRTWLMPVFFLYAQRRSYEIRELQVKNNKNFISLTSPPPRPCKSNRNISHSIFDLLFICRAFTMSDDWKEMDRLEAIRAHIREKERVWRVKYRLRRICKIFLPHF